MGIGEGGIWHIQEIYARPRPHPQLDLKGATSTGKAGKGKEGKVPRGGEMEGEGVDIAWPDL